MIKHWHHIIPRHAGGTDDPENLVHVTIEEHAELHRKRWEELGQGYDKIAWLTLSGQMTKGEALYEASRIANTGRPGWRQGIPCPEYIREKISKTLMGHKINAKKWRIVNTKTQEVDIITDLKSYCQANGIKYKHASCASCRGKQYLNYRISKL
jgi:hypothetical protein